MSTTWHVLLWHIGHEVRVHSISVLSTLYLHSDWIPDVFRDGEVAAEVVQMPLGEMSLT